MIKDFIGLTTPLTQNAWVVEDIDEAMHKWLSFGVGPFITFEVQLPEVNYRGQSVPMHIEVACAQAGNLQIELIKQLNDAPSAYRDVFPSGNGGFHHVCRAYGDYDAIAQGFHARGIPLAVQGGVEGARFCYADTRDTIGCMFEFVDETPMGNALNNLVREVAINWDGHDPIRRVDLMSLA